MTASFCVYASIVTWVVLMSDPMIRSSLNRLTRPLTLSSIVGALRR